MTDRFASGGLISEKREALSMVVIPEDAELAWNV